MAKSAQEQISQTQHQVAWRTFDGFQPYAGILAAMEAYVDAMIGGAEPEGVWLLEHEPTITAGTSADPQELMDPGNLPVHQVGRGGRFTWHGPGQRVAYTMLDLNRRKKDVRLLVSSLERWIAAALASFGVTAGPRAGRIGLWVDRSADRGPGCEDKIAAVGIRLRKWVSFHGISINVAPDLSEFDRIVPCGIEDPRYGVTSLSDLGLDISMAELDGALRKAFAQTIDLHFPTVSN